MKTLYLPQVHGNATVAGEGEYPVMNERAEAFADAWFALLPKARQAVMRFDSRLAACAQAHAEYLSQRTGSQLLESMHRGEGGSYSNGRVLASGYRLPKGYDPDKNMVESCARDGRDPATVAVSLANHEPHRQHMLGLPGFEDRTVYGVGCSGNDYVFIGCPPERDDQ